LYSERKTSIKRFLNRDKAEDFVKELEWHAQFLKLGSFETRIHTLEVEE
jgi:hypothetical protein